MAGFDRSVTARIGLIQHHVVGLDDDLAARRHGIARVHHQIHDDLFDLAWIGLHLTQAGSLNRQDINVLADQSSQHLVRARD